MSSNPASTITVLADFDPALYESAEAPLVTLYVPTYGASTSTRSLEQLEALCSQAKEALSLRFQHRERANLDATLDEFRARFAKLAGPAEEGSLALFAGNDGAFAYRLNYPVEPLALVGQSFYVKPLLKHFEFGERYLLLGLNADRFALIQGDFGSLEREKLPHGVDDGFSKLFPSVYDGHAGALDYRSLENHLPPYHGWKSRNDVKKEEAEKFFRFVDQTVAHRVAHDTNLPVILVSLPEHQTAFRRISTIANLLDEGIEKNADGIEAPELLADAKAVIERERARRANKLLQAYGSAEAHGGATWDLSQIGLALAERKVRALFVARGAYVPGGYNVQTGEVFLFERQPHDRFEGPELADAFARAALAQDADVLELPAEKVPGTTGIAALFRY